MNTKLHSILARVVPEINNELEAINHGGCGHFAHGLSKALAVRGVPSEVVLVDLGYTTQSVAWMMEEQDCSNINDTYLKMFAMYARLGWIDCPCNGHLALRVDGRLYDSNGLYSGAAISEGIRPDVMEEFLIMPCWNDYFVRHNEGDLPSIIDTMHAFFDTALLGVCYE